MSTMIRAGVASTVVLAALAVAQHPQGDVARVVPYAVGAGIVWVAVAAAVAGPRAAARVACALAAPGLLAVALYVLFVEPIPFAECGRLIQELGRPACRSHGSVGLMVAAGSGSVLSGAALWWLKAGVPDTGV
jgi:hypothetical protein